MTAKESKEENCQIGVSIITSLRAWLLAFHIGFKGLSINRSVRSKGGLLSQTHTADHIGQAYSRLQITSAKQENASDLFSLLALISSFNLILRVM